MYIKIYTKSQLILLRRVQELFKKRYRLPQELLDQVETVLKGGQLGSKGFVAILLEPVRNDVTEIQDKLDCYPSQLKTGEDIIGLLVPDDGRWLTKDKEWYMDTLKIKDDASCVFVIYSMTVETLYEE